MHSDCAYDENTPLHFCVVRCERSQRGSRPRSPYFSYLISYMDRMEERMLHLSAEVTLRYLPASQQQFHVCSHTGVCRFRCSARLSGLLSWTQITSEALLLLPVSALWGPGLIHFCPWALARNHTDKSIGCPLMGQTLFFSTGACRVGKYVQLAGPDLSAKFSFSWQ